MSDRSETHSSSSIASHRPVTPESPSLPEPTVPLHPFSSLLAPAPTATRAPTPYPQQTDRAASDRAKQSPDLPDYTDSYPSPFAPGPSRATRASTPYSQRTNRAAFDRVSEPPNFLGHTDSRPSTFAPGPSRAWSAPTSNPQRAPADDDDDDDDDIAKNKNKRLLTDWNPTPDPEHQIPTNPSPRPDWGLMWSEENDPHETPWVGHDNSRFAMEGGVEDPTETAAVPNEFVMESIELEGDPLPLLREWRDRDQKVVRGQLDLDVDRDDGIAGDEGLSRRELSDRLEVAGRRAERLTRELEFATARETTGRARRQDLEYEREGLQMERNHYRAKRNEQRALNGQLRAQMQGVNGQLAAATGRNDDLQAQIRDLNDQLAAASGRNDDLQLQMQRLNGRLTAAQALAARNILAPPAANGSPVATPPAAPSPAATPSLAATPSVAAPSASPPRASRAGRGRGSARGRAGRAGRFIGTPTRRQPKRTCKVEKIYRK